MDNLPSGAIESLISDGYFIIEGAVPNNVCDYFVQRTWSMLPGSWDRDCPQTWEGEVEDSCHRAELSYRRGHIKFQKGFLLEDSLCDQSFGVQSSLGVAAGNLFGKSFAVRHRGLYCIAPVSPKLNLRLISAPHVEAHPVHLIALTYLSDVEEGGGGLLVWPGSHLELHDAFSSKMDHLTNREYERLYAKYSALQPLEISGEKGTSIVIHHRLFHAPSLNFSRNMRFAMLTDYVQSDFKRQAGERPGEVFEEWGGVSPERAPRSSHCYQRQQYQPDVFTPPATNASTWNKREASRLVRVVRPGERWLVISSSPGLRGTCRIEPCGNVEADALAGVWENGRAVTSESKFDFIAKLDRGNSNHVRIRPAHSELFVRVIDVEPDVHRSTVVLDQEFDCEGRRDIDLTFEALERHHAST